MKEENVVIPISESNTVSGILSIPDAGQMDTGVILAHGAGNDMSNPLLVSLAKGLADAGYLVLRFNFLYRDMGKRALTAKTGCILHGEVHVGFSPNILNTGQSI